MDSRFSSKRKMINFEVKKFGSLALNKNHEDSEIHWWDCETIPKIFNSYTDEHSLFD